jgi:hypothetical protein
MPRVGFEPTILASKRAKTVHGLDHLATVTSVDGISIENMQCSPTSSLLIHYCSNVVQLVKFVMMVISYCCVVYALNGFVSIAPN